MALFSLSGVLRGFQTSTYSKYALGLKPLCGLAQRKNCSFPTFIIEKEFVVAVNTQT